MRRVAGWLVSLVAVAAASPASAMTMRVAGDQIVLQGPVHPDDGARFRELLAANAAVKTIILRDSAGGDAAAGYEIGGLIREKGLRTALSGYCRSSCSRMFLGGVERGFTDEQRAGKTYVAFHGHYEDDGQLKTAMIPTLREWIVAHSDGKADRALVERWTALPDRAGFAYFFDSERLRRRDRVSVFLCSGMESRTNRYEECEKIRGRTGYDLGIFTPMPLVKVNPELAQDPAEASDPDD